MKTTFRKWHRQISNRENKLIFNLKYFIDSRDEQYSWVKCIFSVFDPSVGSEHANTLCVSHTWAVGSQPSARPGEQF